MNLTWFSNVFGLSLKGSRQWIIFYYRICFFQETWAHALLVTRSRRDLQCASSRHSTFRGCFGAEAVGKDFRKWFRGWVSSSSAGSSIKCTKGNPQASSQVFQSTFRAGSILQIVAQIMTCIMIQGVDAVKQQVTGSSLQIVAQIMTYIMIQGVDAEKNNSWVPAWFSDAGFFCVDFLDLPFANAGRLHAGRFNTLPSPNRSPRPSKSPSSSSSSSSKCWWSASTSSSSSSSSSNCFLVFFLLCLVSFLGFFGCFWPVWFFSLSAGDDSSEDVGLGGRWWSLEELAAPEPQMNSRIKYVIMWKWSMNILKRHHDWTCSHWPHLSQSTSHIWTRPCSRGLCSQGRCSPGCCSSGCSAGCSSPGCWGRTWWHQRVKVKSLKWQCRWKWIGASDHPKDHLELY